MKFKKKNLNIFVFFYLLNVYIYIFSNLPRLNTYKAKIFGAVNIYYIHFTTMLYPSLLDHLHLHLYIFDFCKVEKLFQFKKKSNLNNRVTIRVKMV